MGRLKPGATYIYERDGSKVYAREMNAHPGDRILIGYDYDGSGKELEHRLEKYKEDHLWSAIRKEAESNPALQDALERVKIVYELSRKDDDDKPGWHPV